jgi:hypothetical protein
MTAIRFPSPSRFATEIDFLDKGVYRWLTRITGAKLYQHFKSGEVLPDADALVEWLDEQASSKVSKYIVDYQSKSGDGSWSGEYYDRQLRRAVEFCLENYAPEVVHARASKGGQRSKRPRRFTLHAFAALPLGLTEAQQAAAMGCKSIETIRKLRRELENYDPVLAGEFDSPPAPPLVRGA